MSRRWTTQASQQVQPAGAASGFALLLRLERLWPDHGAGWSRGPSGPVPTCVPIGAPAPVPAGLIAHLPAQALAHVPTHVPARRSAWCLAAALMLAGPTGAATAAGAAGGHAPPDSPLPPAVQAALLRTGLPADALAAAALPLGHRAQAWGHRAAVPMQPASAMKVLTTAVALDQLGPGHRGRTELLSAAPLESGTLQGDLVLKGGADPELGVPQLWALLLDLRQAGVQHIAGDLRVDRTLFNPPRSDQGLPPFDEAPEFPYNVIPDALLLAGNLLPLELRATDTGVAAATVPALPGLELASRMLLDERPCASWSSGWLPATVEPLADGQTRITLNGSFPRGCERRVALQLIDRQELAERLFRALWQGLGGSWAGRAVEAAAPPGARVLAQRSSRPLGEWVRQVNKVSDNALTRLLFLQLGVQADAAPTPAEPPTTQQAADAAVRRWLAAQGIADDGLVLDNGSGLSRTERISPWQLAQVLRAAHGGRHAPELVMSLPVAGVDGGLRNRLADSPAAGWARLKPGTLRNAVALAGIVSDPQGRTWAVAMMINHERASAGRPVLDALVDHIAREGPHGAPLPLPGPQGDGP